MLGEPGLRFYDRAQQRYLPGPSELAEALAPAEAGRQAAEARVRELEAQLDRLQPPCSGPERNLRESKNRVSFPVVSGRRRASAPCGMASCLRENGLTNTLAPIH